ncbi:alpha-1,2-mannosidase [Streptomyces sp. NPDC005840]|uniref:alpha-1,2-mannosidase n=1 Tax=Streptomyces sp. NPDC005840 TaxID=3157072 RepID=UPI0033FACB7A
MRSVPVFADFSSTPARLSNAVVVHHRCGIAPTHLALGPGGHIKVDFTVDAPAEDGREPGDAVVTVTLPGTSAPLDVLLNGKALAERLEAGGEGADSGARRVVLTAPADALTAGANLLEVRNPEGSDALLRIAAVTVAPAHDQDRAERAMAARTAARSVVTFDTHVRAPGTTAWQPAPPVRFHLDAGGRAVPAQLSWRGTDGSEASVGLGADLSGFLGHRRAADATVTEYRGTLTERLAYPDGTAGTRLRRFSTEEARGDVWTPSGELRLLLDDGGAPLERVTWTDRNGDTTSLALSGGVGAPAVAPVGELRDVTPTVVGIDASDEFEEWAEVAENLVSKARTKWLAHDETAEVTFTLAQPAAVAAYRLTSANDAPDRDPRDWSLQGSHDGVHWTAVDSRADERFHGRHEAREYSVAHPASYSRYRLRIERNNGSDLTQLSRVQLLAGGAAQPGPADTDTVDFTGYRALREGAPTGYRGTAVPGPWSDVPGEPSTADGPGRLLAGDLGETARSLDEAARLIGKLSAYLKES